MEEKQIHYTLGLEIGITSVGWAVLQNNAEMEPFKIENLGVRTFEKAEALKTGGSPATDRTSFRGNRRTIRRKRHRKERIKHLIITSGMMSQEQMDELFHNTGYTRNVYQLRVEALDRLLENDEAVRLLIHFAQRRGFVPKSKAETQSDEESGKMRLAISVNHRVMKDQGYRTFGEMLLNDDRFYVIQPDGARVFVPHNKQGDYRAAADRKTLAEELRLIFTHQREFGAIWATDDFEKAYFSIWGSQRNIDDGPGGDSPYGESRIKNQLGHCLFEPEEFRAPKSSFSMEYFRLLQAVNNLRLITSENEMVALTPEERAVYIEMAMNSGTVTYANLREHLHLDINTRFNTLYYGNKDISAVEKRNLGHMQFYHQMRLALEKVEKNAIGSLTWEQKDEIAQVLTIYKSNENRIHKLSEIGIPGQYIEALLELSSPVTSGHLSIKALRKLIPHLEAGESYEDACKSEYQNSYVLKRKRRVKRLSLNYAEEIRNTVARRAVAQSIKVINAIVRTYGPPDRVRIELTQEMGKTFSGRQNMLRNNQNHAERNNEIKAEISKLKNGAMVTGQDIIKYRLFHTQQGICMYSGEKLDIRRLFEKGYADVDHIIPYSISFDDSYNNKVLVLSSENRRKGSRIPYAYFGQDEERWNQFQVRCSQVGNYLKRRNLLTHVLPKKQYGGYKEFNLADTNELSRSVYRLINDNLVFTEIRNTRQRSLVVKRSVSRQIRKRLGVEKICENNYLHHAVVAAAVACVTPGMLQKIKDYATTMECSGMDQDVCSDMETGEMPTKQPAKFPEPWPQFHAELEARLSEHPTLQIAALKLPTYDSSKILRPVLISRMPKHKIRGPAHLDTIRSGKAQGYAVSKVPLTSLKLDKKTGEIRNYYRKEDDLLLYNALKDRLLQYNGNSIDAFKEPFYKPKHNGEPGPIVNKVKVQVQSTLMVQTDRGIAENGRMVRVDVFYVKGKWYYYVPIYASDTVKKDLPNRAVMSHVPYENWKVMDESDFLFSLYPGDLIYIEGDQIELHATSDAVKNPKLKVDSGFFYYKFFSISSNCLAIETHDSCYMQHSLGGRKLSVLKKYQVDVLGNVSEVHLPEKRQCFH